MTSRPSLDPDDLNFSVLPPTELLSEWETDILYEYQNIDITLLKAYQAGADAELEACCEWLFETGYRGTPMSLRAVRRPKPLSLKEKALKALDSFEGFTGSLEEVDVIRHALEQLND